MISAGGLWRIAVLVHQKHAIDVRIREIEAQLEKPEASQEQTDRLVTELNQYETQAQSLEQNALYRLGARDSSDYLNRELRAVMAEFGAEVYSIPPDFVEPPARRDRKMCRVPGKRPAVPGQVIPGRGQTYPRRN